MPDRSDRQVRAILQGNKNRERTKHDVSENLILSHLDVTDGNAQAEHLLELELDGRANIVELVRQVLSVRDRRRELAGCKR